MVPLFAMVVCLVPTNGKPGGVLAVAQETPKQFSSVWVGRADDSDDHFLANEIGYVVRVRGVR